MEGRHPSGLADGRAAVIGILDGEGTGPEVFEATRAVLAAISEACGREFELLSGPPARVADPKRSALSETTAMSPGRCRISTSCWSRARR